MKKILKYYFITVGILTTVFMILFFIGIYHIVRNIGKISVRKADKPIVLKDKDYFLKLNLDATIYDRETSHIETLFSVIESKNQYELLDLITTIDKATSDDRIKGIVVRSLNIEASLASAMEITEALMRFKAKNKRIFIFLDTADNKNYLIASVADKIYLQPEGRLYLPGISGSFIFLKDTLSKLGISGDFIPLGRYKSTPEMFTANKMSDDNRYVETSVLGDIQNTFIELISKNRGKSKETIENIIAQGLLNGSYALENKLVDVLSYKNHFDESMEKEFEDILPLSFRKYSNVSVKTVENLEVDTKNKIAVIYANGQVQMSSPDDYNEKNVIVPDILKKKFQKAQDDPDIKGILFRINSPGGSALASDIIWNEVKRLDKEKPVFVSMGSVVASGGYYLSMPASKLFALDTTITGSIGVWSGKFVMKDLYEKLGLNIETIKFSEGATLFSSQDFFSPDQRELVKSIIAETYETFVKKAAEARGMSYESLDKVAQGRIWSGQQAKKVGLVDNIGGYHEVIGALSARIGIEPDAVPTLVKITEDSDNLFDKLKYIGLSIRSQFIQVFKVHELINLLLGNRWQGLRF